MSLSRKCSRTACTHAAIATLTYVYADSTVVLGPLATHAEPHTYDLCDQHASRLTAPRGWEVVRIAGESTVVDNHDDLAALANVVRRAQAAGSARPASDVVADSGSARTTPPSTSETGRRGHLRMLQDDHDA